MQQNAILSVVMDDLLELDNISLIKFFIKMKRQLTSILLFSALLMGGASTFVSCTDHESDAAYNTSISIADAVTKQIDALKTADQLLQANIDALKNGDVKANKDKIAILEGQVADNTAAIENLSGTMTQKFTDLNTKLQESIGTLNNALANKADKTELEALKEKVNGITVSLPDALDQLNQATQDIAGLRTDLNNKANELQGKIDNLNTDLNNKLGTQGDDIETLKDAKDQINSQLGTMSGQLNDIVAEVANLKSAIADILNKGVTGIEIQATDCPVTGYENAAFLGAQANILSAYWGAPSTGDEEFGVEGGKIIKSDAGNIYININPANVDPSPITFRLVDSQGNDAPGFKLGAPVITDKVLKYGISRATSANGFYAIPVECTDPQNDGLELNKGQLKEAAKNVLAKLQHPKSTNLNLSGLATALYSNINNKLTAYGIQASWKQKDETGKEVDKVDKVVTSKINLAAFAVKPLSFKFLANNSKLDNLSLDRFMFPTGMKEKLNGINGIDFNNIIDPSTGKTIEVATVVAVPGVKVVANGKDLDFIQISDNKKLNTIKNAYIVSEEVANKDISIEVNGESGSTTLTTYIYEIKVQDNTMKELIADLNSNLSTTLGPVKTAINWANTFAGKYDAVVPTVNNLIKKIEGTIHNVNKFLQPAMLFKSSNGNWGFVSTGHRFATSFVGVGATPLVATTYTAELLAPAYKKQLYVKEAGAEILVNGKATKAPFNGEIQKVVFNASKAGKYTIVYKAIDYSGKVVEKNFYVTVK